MELQAVINGCSLSHLDGAARDDPKMEPGRSQQLEVMRVREKSKDLLKRQGHNLLACKVKNSHH